MQHLGDLLAKAVIILGSFDLFNAPKAVEGGIVELVYIANMGVGDDYIGQALHITDSMGDSGRELGSNIVRGAHQSRLGQGAPKHHQLSQADRPSFLGYPSAVTRLAVSHATKGPAG